MEEIENKVLFKMRSKLLDEAVICPKCGCAVDGPSAKNSEKVKTKAKLRTAEILNVIAFVLNILIVAMFVIGLSGAMKELEQDAQNEMEGTADVTVETNIFTGDITDIKDKDEVNDEIQADTDFSRNQYTHYMIGSAIWGVFAVASFILGLKLKKDDRKKMATLYTLMAIPGPLFFLILNNMVVAALFCGFGLVLFVPAILQINAGIKFVQCADA